MSDSTPTAPSGSVFCRFEVEELVFYTPRKTWATVYKSEDLIPAKLELKRLREAHPSKTYQLVLFTRRILE